MNLFVFSVFTFLHMIYIVKSNEARCPAVCNCIWKSGKITAECIGADLLNIPSGASSNLQVINFSKNNFQTLPPKVFQERGLINLQKIYLSECKLGRIAPDSFYQLNNLIELDLSVNLLTSVPTDALNYISRLRRLNLQKNPIRTIRKDSFAELTNLINLDLSDCEIEIIERGAFNALKALDQIKLDGNRLSTLPDDIFNHLPITNIALHRNPWKCDCLVRPILEYLNKFKITPSVPPTCASPSKLSGLMWNSLELSAYACPPTFKVYETSQRAPLASNVSFVCVVKANPSARIYWSAGERSDANSTIFITENNKFTVSEDMSVADSISSTLTIHKIGDEDARRFYVCNAENQAESVSQNFTLILSDSIDDGQNDFILQWLLTGVVIFFITLILIVLAISCRFRNKREASSSDASIAQNNIKQESNPVANCDYVINPTPKDVLEHVDYSSQVMEYATTIPTNYQTYDGTMHITDLAPAQLYYDCDIYQHHTIQEMDEGYSENNFLPFISNETLI